jgi:hypothetical protein
MDNIKMDSTAGLMIAEAGKAPGYTKDIRFPDPHLQF